MSQQPLKMGVCREEFVALTRNPLIALVLNQLLYWTKRIKDYDLYMEEVRENKSSKQHGWIYKSSHDLSEESMVCVSKSTMRRYLSFLTEQGWIEERTNPWVGWDKTIQYRVNLRQLEDDLHGKGYKLPGCFVPVDEVEPSQLSSLTQNEKSKFHCAPPMFQNETSYTYTETTTETINKEDAREKNTNVFLEKIKDEWIRYVPFDHTHLTKARTRRLRSVLETHFQNDLEAWRGVCERVRASPFLMGGGPTKWRISLDWILKKDNLLKVLEGKYDDPKQTEVHEAETSREARNHEIEETLAAIKDPVWRKWCSKLVEGVRLNDAVMIVDPIPLFELKAIADARFIECDEEGLVWIESPHLRVLNRIDDIAIKINWVFKNDYPHGRTLRTRQSIIR